MEKQKNIHDLRQSFSALHASDHPATRKNLSVFKESVIASSGNTFYEELQSVSYHPDFQMLEAIFVVKRDFGYNGNLCTGGSFAFVRFYLDYGTGWEDQGYTAVNEHDIPTGIDCTKDPEKPLSYSASLNIIPKTDFCSRHVLPKARAILEWNKIPPADMPDYDSIWGNTIDDHIQIKPRKKLIFENVDVAQLVELAVAQPELKLADAAKIVPNGETILQQSKALLKPVESDLGALVEIYKGNKIVTPGRYGLKSIQSTLSTFDSEIIAQNIELWKQYGIDWTKIISELESTSADVSYEQIESVGFDYNLEQFIASIRIKRPAGYSGDLCTAGSLEYVSFWADWNNDCNWHYVGATTVNVHDINDIPADGLSYAAILPYDFNALRKQCADPEVVKIRAVLSWNIAPSSTDADKLEYWGNRIDAYIQIKPGVGTGELKPVINILGGIPVDKISDINGLTIPGAKFALNQLAVNDYSPFGGVIVVQGPSFIGHRYRIKITNMSTLASYYIGNDFTVVGWLPVPPYVQYTTVHADPFTFYYNYQPFEKNTDNVLARWSPGTNDLLKLEMDIEGVGNIFTKFIQMDNASPVINLTIDDSGDCTHYKMGDIITGSYSIYDAHLLNYTVASTFGGSVSGTVNVFNTFSFPTAGAATPCGKVYLIAYEKTIYDSQWTNNSSYTEQIICLQPNTD
ncbi:MAG TPA: hypothetical protein VFW07_11825 [Parafilimonas sp.]|nr:hypothetical protein [Parafilimonas sp.]